MITFVAIVAVVVALIWFLALLGEEEERKRNQERQENEEIERLKSTLDIESLKAEVRQSWRSRRGVLAARALETFGYSCSYHEAEGHYELQGDGHYQCANNSGTNVYGCPGCVNGSMCTQGQVETWIEDKPVWIEIVNPSVP